MGYYSGDTSTKSTSENTTSVHTFSANEDVTWSLNGGADVDKFSIDSSSGALSFISAPDYESPTDSDSDNKYEVIVQATDKFGNTSDQAVTVIIENFENETTGSDDDDTFTVPKGKGGKTYLDGKGGKKDRVKLNGKKND